MKRFGCVVLALLLMGAAHAHAQQSAIDDLKGKIFDAHMTERTFADGLKFCNELNGKSFFQRLHNRLLNLEEYVRSLDNLVKAQVFNPAKQRPWSLEDAKERWEAVKKQAQDEKEQCELVRSLPELEKRLQELEKSAAAPQKKE